MIPTDNQMAKYESSPRDDDDLGKESPNMLLGKLMPKPEKKEKSNDVDINLNVNVKTKKKALVMKD